MGDRPIDVPSAATGAYVAVLGYGIGTTVGIGPVLLVGCVLGWTAVSLALTRRPSMWVALGRRRLLAVPMVVPLGPAVVLTVGLEYEGTAVSLPAVLWVLGLAIVGMVIWAAGTTSYAEQAAGKRLVSWTATADAVSRRRTIGIAALGVLGSVGAFAAMVLYRLPSFFLTFFVVVTVTQWIRNGRERTYDACEHGLRYGESGAVGSQFIPWTRFDGVTVTDGAVVLERRRWVDVRMAADAVPAGAREALAESIDE